MLLGPRVCTRVGVFLKTYSDRHPHAGRAGSQGLGAASNLWQPVSTLNATGNHQRPNSQTAPYTAQSTQELSPTVRGLVSAASDDGRHQHAPRSLGRDELNLVDFPIGMLKYQQPTDAEGRRREELVFAVDAFEEDAGSVVPRKVTIRTSSKYGFPTPKEDELLIGLMLHCSRRNNFTESRAEFRISELLRLLGWPDNGRSRRQLREGLDRLAGVRLKFENSWRSSEGKAYEREFNTGILDSYELRVAKDGSGPDARELTAIQWSAEVFADIQRGNVKELNTSEYFALTLPLSRRLYRFLDKHLLPGRVFEMNLLRFAAHLGISESRHIGKIRERLKKPLQELDELGTLFQPAIDADRFHRLGAGDWLIRFERMEGSRQTVPAPQPPALEKSSRPAPRREQPAAAQQLVREFYRQWCDNPQHNPSISERKLAQTTLDRYGHNCVQELLPQVVKIMRERFPEAMSFGATKNYWHLAGQKQTTRKNQDRKRQDRQTQEQHDAQRREQDRERKRQLEAEWNRLEEPERDAIRRELLQGENDFVRRKIEQRQYSDPLVMLACLSRLEQRRPADRPAER